MALICHTKLQIKFEFGFDRPTFHGVMALGLRKFHKLSVFRTFFFSLLADIHLIFGTLLCHTKLQIKFEFGFNQFIFSPLPTKSKGTLDLHSVRLSVSPVNHFSALFFSLLTDIHLIFGTLLCHTKFQIKFESGFNLFIIPHATSCGGV